SPGLTSRHRRHCNFVQLTRFLETAVPLAHRTLPFANGQIVAINRDKRVAANRGRKNIDSVVRALRQRDRLPLRNQNVQRAGSARSQLEPNAVESQLRWKQLAAQRLLLPIELTVGTIRIS